MPQTVIQIAILLEKCVEIYEKCNKTLYEVEIEISILIGYSASIGETVFKKQKSLDSEVRLYYTEADFEVLKFEFWNFLTCMKIIQSMYHTSRSVKMQLQIYFDPIDCKMSRNNIAKLSKHSWST